MEKAIASVLSTSPPQLVKAITITRVQSFPTGAELNIGYIVTFICRPLLCLAERDK